MQCDHAQELFSDYVTGEIDRALTVSIENHLAVCKDCRETVGDLRQAWAMLDQMPVVEPPPLFHATLMGRLAEEQAQAVTEAARPAVHWDWRALFRPRALAFAATILILLMAGAEVVQTQRAALGPLGWMMNLFRPAPSALQTARAEWVPDPVTGGGRITVYLKAKPVSVVAPTRYSYRLYLETQRKEPVASVEAPRREGEVSSETETTITWHSEMPPSDPSTALKIELSPADEPNELNPPSLPIPIVTKASPSAAP
jgi:hypothetical protein